MKRLFVKQRFLSKHSGYSLLEMVLVISLMSALFPILTGILFYCMRTERSFDQEARKMQLISRLSSQLRNDIHTHRWNQIEIRPNHDLHLTGDRSSGAEITYSWKEDGLWRQENRIKGQKLTSERYWFPKGSKIHWSQEEQTQSLILQIDHPTRTAHRSQTDSVTLRQLEIKALAGRLTLPSTEQGTNK